MKDKRVVLSVLALLVFLMFLVWKFWLPGNSTPPATITTPVPLLVQQSVQIAIAPKPAVMATAAVPKLPVVEASEASSSPYDNDWGDIEFTDGAPVVRMLTTGEICIIVPTVISHSNGSNSNAVRLSMLIEQPGPSLSSAAIEALRGRDLQDMINAEYMAARQNSGGKTMSNIMVTAISGQELEIGPGSTVHAGSHSMRFKPIIKNQ